MPCVMRWPGKIPTGKTCRELVSTLDFLPTFAALAEGQISKNRKIDGHDVRNLIFGKLGAKSPRKAFFYYHTTQLQAVRSDKWKLVLPQAEKLTGWSGKEKDSPLQLFDVSTDLGEQTNLADAHPDVVKRLIFYADEARQDLGDGNESGKGQRPAGWVKEAKPLLKAQ